MIKMCTPLGTFARSSNTLSIKAVLYHNYRVQHDVCSQTPTTGGILSSLAASASPVPTQVHWVNWVSAEGCSYPAVLLQVLNTKERHVAARFSSVNVLQQQLPVASTSNASRVTHPRDDSKPAENTKPIHQARADAEAHARAHQARAADCQAVRCDERQVAHERPAQQA